jgi:hypothetical protein
MLVLLMVPILQEFEDIPLQAIRRQLYKGSVNQV